MSSLVQVELTHIQGVPVLRFRGELRLEVAEPERELNRLAAGRPPVVVLDFSGLTIISSLGMGLINAFRRGLHAYGGVTRIAAAQRDVLQALTLCGLDRLFQMYDTVEAAVAAPAESAKQLS